MTAEKLFSMATITILHKIKLTCNIHYRTDMMLKYCIGNTLPSYDMMLNMQKVCKGPTTKKDPNFTYPQPH